jgi:hypothetical protein
MNELHSICVLDSSRRQTADEARDEYFDCCILTLQASATTDKRGLVVYTAYHSIHTSLSFPNHNYLITFPSRRKSETKGPRDHKLLCDHVRAIIAMPPASHSESHLGFTGEMGRQAPITKHQAPSTKRF